MKGVGTDIGKYWRATSIQNTVRSSRESDSRDDYLVTRSNIQRVHRCMQRRSAVADCCSIF